MAPLFRKSQYSTLNITGRKSAFPGKLVTPAPGAEATDPLKRREIPEGLWENANSVLKWSLSRQDRKIIMSAPNAVIIIP